MCYLPYSATGDVVKVVYIINHTLPSTIRAVIGTLTCMSMASNSTSDSECYIRPYEYYCCCPRIEVGEMGEMYCDSNHYTARLLWL